MTYARQCQAETTEKAEAGEEDKANFSQAPALSSLGCRQGLKQVALVCRAWLRGGPQVW